MRRSTPFLALCVIAGAGRSAAQTPADTGGVAPGGIATTVVILHPPAGADSIAYSLTPTDGVRLFVRSGHGRIRADTPVRIPVTFGVPARAPAGPFTAATLEARWSSGEVAARDVVVRVRARRAVSFWIGAEDLTLAPATPAEISYHLQNRGNAPDSFRIAVAVPADWAPAAAPPTVALAPGDTASGTIRLVAPDGSAPGDQRLVTVTVEGEGIRESRSAHATVTGEESWLGDWSHVAARAFIGSSSDLGGAPGLALTAGGEVRPGVRLQLDLRRASALAPPPAFRSALSGPRIRVGLDAPFGHARLGDIFTSTDVFTGPVFQGRGIELALRHGVLEAEATAAAPVSYGLAGERGHVLRASGGVRTNAGRFGVQISSLRRESTVFDNFANTGAGFTYEIRAGANRLEARAGVLRVQDDSMAVTGFAGEASYSVNGRRGSLIALLRKVPATTPRTASMGDQATVSGNVTVTRELAFTGWAFHTAAPTLAPDAPFGRADGLAAGVRGSTHGGINGDVLGSYRRSEQVGTDFPASFARSVRSRIDIPVGSVRLDADAEVGTLDTDSLRPLRRLRTGLRFGGRRQWASASVTYVDLGSATSTTFDLTGLFHVRGADIQGGFNGRLDAPAFSDAVTFWTGLSLPVGRDYRIDFGADYRPNALDSPWRLSLGASRSFELPLPLPRTPVLRGLVFDDLDGDLARSPDEPLLAGVPVHFGPLRTRTDEDGEFRFYDEVQGELRVDAATLSDGYVMPAGFHPPTSGRVEIPVFRTAVLRLRLFLDRDGDSEKDPAETYADRFPFSLAGPDGSMRAGTTDEQGRAEFRGIAPGVYTLIVQPPRGAPARAAPTRIELALPPGATVDRTLAVPLRRREIRIRGGGLPLR